MPQAFRTAAALAATFALALSSAAAPEPPKPEALAALARDNAAFATDLYRKLSAAPGNLFFSPHSVSAALAMTWAGARGNTETQMAQTLHFTLGQQGLHPAFAALAQKLDRAQKEGALTLAVANSLWPQKQYPLLESYLTLVQTHYGASVTPLDFAGAAESARKTINRWVETRTRGKITQLVPPGVLDSLTRLVLVNAVYFKGKWAHPFKPAKTKPEPFHVSPARTVNAPTMAQTEDLRYADLDTFQLLELPYAGGALSMLVLLPKDPAGLPALEAALTAENLARWKERLAETNVQLFLPRFKTTAQFRLDDALQALGMPEAFAPGKADFSGMDGRPGWLFIGAVIHKAFVDVAEEGTEAAAATAVSMKCMALPPPPRQAVFRADHPFVFLIQENETGAILFIGRLSEPPPPASAA